MHDDLLRHPSAIEGIAWPPLAQGHTAALLALLRQLHHTSTLSDAELADAQGRQLGSLAAHAWAQSPFFRMRLENAGLRPEALRDTGALSALPILTRREVQDHYAALLCESVPASHLPLVETGTSGSLGQPVIVQRTQVTQLFWAAFTAREHLWNRRRETGTLAVIRSRDELRDGVRFPDWGYPVSHICATGPMFGFHSGVPASELVSRLSNVDPHYLLTYPTNLQALLDEFEARKITLPNLLQIRSFGETVTDALRERVRRVLGVGIADCYSSQELGLMAIQDPGGDAYHVMAESYVVEIVDHVGQPCAPGELGRIVVTDLQNFAMPLVRYDTGDFGVAGNAGRGERGMPTMRRIMGRQRNLAWVNGVWRRPVFSPYVFRKVAPVLQFQVVQDGATSLEVKLVCETALNGVQEAAIRDILLPSFSPAFNVRFTYHAEPLATGRTGKFEEFICRLP